MLDTRRLNRQEYRESDGLGIVLYLINAAEVVRRIKESIETGSTAANRNAKLTYCASEVSNPVPPFELVLHPQPASPWGL